MRRYETIFIAHSDLPDDTIDVLIEQIRKIIRDLKGIVIRVEKLGKRKLAYPIKKQQKGYYILMDFVGERAVIGELERNMKFNEKVLKYMSVKKAERVDLEEIEKEATSAKKDEKPEETTSAETITVSNMDTTADTDGGELSEESSEEKERKE